MKSSVNKLKRRIYFLVLLLVIIFSLLIYHLVNLTEEYKVVENENKFIYYDSEYQSVDKNELINSNYTELFNSKINELTYKKYPKFIADILVSENVTKDYKVNNNSLYITFSQIAVEDKTLDLDLKVSCSLVKDYINAYCNEDEEVIIDDGYSIDQNKKTIAITFDDGPHRLYTNQIINLLNENKARATFFVIGVNVKHNADIIKNIHNSNHEIAIHGLSHQYFTRMSIDAIYKEIIEVNKLVYDLVGTYSTLVRPPYGALNDNIIENVDYSFIKWNVDTNDWRIKNSDTIVTNVMNEVSDGSIILFHDMYQNSVDTVKKLLPLLYLEGYQIVDVSTLAKIKNKPIELNEVYREF